MSRRRVMSRRTLLRGAGTVAIGLPFLDAMRPRVSQAGPPGVPERALTLFFSLGVPPTIAAEGLTTSLRPLQPFASKLMRLPGVDLDACDTGGNNHFDGSGGVFVGLPPQGEFGNAGGPSIDQVLKRGWYPSGPPTPIDTLMFGTFFRRNNGPSATPTRYIHAWTDDGSPVDQPLETPQALFERLFGTDDGPPEGDQRAERSVLDAVVEQYRHVTSPRYGLGPASVQRVDAHLEKIRELERRIFLAPGSCDSPPGAPGEMPLLHGQPVDDGGPVIQISEWSAVWQVACELMGVALRCDLTRFGSMMFQSGGERAHLQGNYRLNGDLVCTFDDQETFHEYWHGWDPNATSSTDHVWLRHHLTYMMDQIATYLAVLDDPTWPDANGATILDNAFLMMGTELGFPGSNFHGLQNVWHAVSGAGGRLATGGQLDQAMGCVDLYRTCTQALGVSTPMGREDRFTGLVTELVG